jgi:pimeloyl-ACP methyl ester carboxylesterase
LKEGKVYGLHEGSKIMDISETHFVTAADGVRLYVRIKGKQGLLPPVLYLHGGPGGALNLAAFETCAGPLLEPCFTVAYLHQRGVFRSERPEKTDQNFYLHIQDIQAVVAFLCHRFQHRRIYLLGHSWGGFTGFAYLGRYESTVARFVAISPVVSFPDMQQELYALVSHKVMADRDASALQELVSIGKPPYPDIDDFIRLQGLGAEKFGDPYQYIIPRDLTQYTGYPLDLTHCMVVQSQIAESLWPELYRLDLTASLETFTTPLLMIACGLDSAVPVTSVERAFKAYATGRPVVEKRWLLLEESNHLPFTEPAAKERCFGKIIEFLLPDPASPARHKRVEG